MQRTARISRGPMADASPDPSLRTDGDTWLVADGREIEMDRYARRQYFDSLCRLRDTYVELGADDTTSCISIEDVIAMAIDLLERPLETAIDADEARPKAA
jgi:hypothetical protein